MKLDPRHRYVFPAPVFIPTIILGMAITYLCAYGPSPLPFPLNYLEELSLILFRSRKVTQLVFWAASITHVFEAGLALREANRINMPLSLSITWTLATFIWGYPSLKELYGLSKLKK